MENFSSGQISFASGGIGHGEAVPVAAGVADGAEVEAVAAGFAQFDGLAGEFLDGLTDFMRRGVCGHGRAERYGHRIRNTLGQFPKIFTALKAEDAAPDAIEMHGDDGHIQVPGDFFEPAFEWAHVAGEGERAFGKDAHGVAGGQLGARGADGFHDAAAVARVHRNRMHAAQEGAKRGHLVIIL